MNISITPFTLDEAGGKVYGTPINLTGTEAAEQVSDFQLNGRNEIELGQAIAAGGIEPFDRGNQQNTITFRISRTHADPGSAAHFLFAHLMTLPPVGRVTFTFVNNVGFVIFQTYMNAGAISGYRGNFIGLSSDFYYQLVGGAFATSPG